MRPHPLRGPAPNPLLPPEGPQCSRWGAALPFCRQAVSWGQGLQVSPGGSERLRVLAEVSQEGAVPCSWAGAEGRGWLGADAEGLWDGKS